MDKQSLEQWLRNPGIKHRPILPPQAPAEFVGIHDTNDIAHIRTYLWDLSDYRVSDVEAGVIWLVRRAATAVGGNVGLLPEDEQKEIADVANLIRHNTRRNIRSR